MSSSTRLFRGLSAWVLACASAMGAPCPEPQGGGSEPAPSEPTDPGASGGGQSSDPAGGDGKLPPGLVRLLRKGASTPNDPPPPPRPGRTPGEDDLRPESGVRAWELWWQLHRDRYIDLGRDDLSLQVGKVPPDPRTRAQSADALVGAFERIGPTLRVVLTHERSEIVLARALIALGKLGEDPREPGSRATYATIVPYLDHEDATLREAAITALGALGGEQALFPLCEIALGRPTPAGAANSGAAHGRPSLARPTTDRQRALALYAIGMIARDSTREDVRRFVASRLCAALGGDARGGDARERVGSGGGAEVRFAALQALSLVPLTVEPPRAAEPVESRPGRRPWKRRQPSVYPRGEATSPARIPSSSRGAEIDWLIARLDDPREEGWIRAQAATALGRLCAGLPDTEGTPAAAIRARAAERLTAALATHTKDPAEVRRAAVLALGEFGDGDKDPVDARVRATLARTLAEADEAPVREFAYLALALAASRPGGPAEDPDRLCAAADVRRILLERAATVRAVERPYAVLALGLLERGLTDAGLTGSDESRSALAALLEEARSTELAGVCALACGLAGAGEATSELIERLSHGDVGVRRHAALALGLLHAREAAPAIERLLASARQEAELYRDASEALALLGAPVGRQLLGWMNGGSLEAQMNLCAALGRVGGASSLRALSQLSIDDSALIWVRAAATSALGNLGDRRGRAWNADFGHALDFHRVPPTLSSAALDGLLDLD